MDQLDVYLQQQKNRSTFSPYLYTNLKEEYENHYEGRPAKPFDEFLEEQKDLFNHRVKRVLTERPPLYRMIEYEEGGCDAYKTLLKNGIDPIYYDSMGLGQHWSIDEPLLNFSVGADCVIKGYLEVPNALEIAKKSIDFDYSYGEYARNFYSDENEIAFKPSEAKIMVEEVCDLFYIFWIKGYMFQFITREITIRVMSVINRSTRNFFNILEHITNMFTYI